MSQQLEDPFKTPLENGELFEETPIFEKKNNNQVSEMDFTNQLVFCDKAWSKVNFSIVVLIQMCKNFYSYW